MWHDRDASLTHGIMEDEYQSSISGVHVLDVSISSVAMVVPGSDRKDRIRLLGKIVNIF